MAFLRLLKPRGQNGAGAGRYPNYGFTVNGCSAWSLPEQSQESLRPKSETLKESLVKALQITCQTKRITAKRCIHYASHKQDAIGCYREKAKMEKGVDLGDPGKKNHGKIER